MSRMILAARKFYNDEDGAALAEYGILVAFIAVVCITVITIFGRQISDKFQSVSTALS